MALGQVRKSFEVRFVYICFSWVLKKYISNPVTFPIMIKTDIYNEWAIMMILDMLYVKMRLQKQSRDRYSEM